jgi:WD40 repeat protein
MVKLWEAGSGPVLQTLKGHLGAVWAMAFSPDSRLLASASSDGTVKLWEVDSRAALQTLDGHVGPVDTVAFSPDGKLLASASSNGTVKLWEIDSEAALQTLEGHSEWVSAVAFSPDSRLLASASGDGTVKLWEVGSRAALQTFDIDTAVQTLSFSDDGSLIQTNRGQLHREFPSDGTAISRANLPRTILITKQWISSNMANFLWLPSDHRPSCVAVHGGIVCFGYHSGRVSFMEFAC